jgi:hypothetical protein
MCSELERVLQLEALICREKFSGFEVKASSSEILSVNYLSDGFAPLKALKILLGIT